MKTLFLLSASLLLARLLQAQAALTPMAAGDWGCTSAGSPFGDAFSGSVNPAGLAGATQLVAGVYGERRFLLKALSLTTAAVIVPVRSGAAGLLVRYFGSPEFHISAVGASYGRRLGSHFDLGGQINLHSTAIAGYGTFHTLTFQIGTIFHVTEKMQLSVFLYNPLRGSFGLPADENYAAVYSSALSVTLSDRVLTAFTVSSGSNEPPVAGWSLRYYPGPHFFCRAGVATAGTTCYWGFGLGWKNLRLEVSSAWHNRLGITPGLLLEYRGTDRKNAALP